MKETGCPLQYLGLENLMDSITHRVAKSRILLNDFHLSFFFPLIILSLVTDVENRYMDTKGERDPEELGNWD